jgi:2-dehydro-3-deoxyphosphogluconate aldolase/(4S)-4-hydroxy-2-oxoglutarate aldolase
VSAVLEELCRLRLVPLIVIDEAAKAEALARALVDGGLPLAEIAFRTAAAADAIRRIAAEHPEVLVGAGTVRTSAQAAQARKAGARFLVSPGLSPRVVAYGRDHELPVIPGVCTPTEVGAALDLGLGLLKFFPAESAGGLPYLKAIAAPFPDVAFVPTGGIGPDNLAAYLAFDRVAACGGSWMAPRAWIEAGDFDRIRDEVRRAVRLAHPPAAGG